MKYSFYTPIAYDYKFSYATILSYYDIADEIILAIDRDRISWAGKKYEFNNEEFFSKIEQIDKQKKIIILEDNFHENSPIENDTQERNFISKKCSGDYIIGIDSDEVLLNPKEFLAWLNSQDDFKSDIECTWYTVYKSYGKKLLITQPEETTVIGTNLKGYFQKCRFTSKNSLVIPRKLSPLKVLHFSWGRSKDDFVQKLKNWSHTNDFDIERYIKIWDSVNLKNYIHKKDLHPLALKEHWKSLRLVDVEFFNISDKVKDEMSKFSYSIDDLNFSIIIKIEKNSNLKRIRRCIESIERYYRFNDVIFLVEEDNDGEKKTYIQSKIMAYSWKIIKCMSFEDKDVLKIIIDVSNEDNLFFISPNCVVNQNVFMILNNSLNEQRVGAVGPSSSYSNNSQTIKEAFEKRFIWSNKDTEEFALSIEKNNEQEDIVLDSSFCFGVKKRICKNLNTIDLLKIREFGYKTMHLKGCYIHYTEN